MVSGSIVRKSKFRHVHGKAGRKSDGCHLNLTKMATNGEGPLINSNGKWVAISYTGGGGPVVVTKYGKYGKLPNRPPVVNVHKSQVFDLQFSPFMPDLLATGSSDCYVKLTVIPKDGIVKNISEAAVTLEGHMKKVAYVKFHPTANNVLASASNDNTVKVWDVEQAEEAHDLEFDAAPQCIDWSQDGKYLAVATKDKLVHIMDPRAKDGALNFQPLSGSKPQKVVFGNDTKIFACGFSKTAKRQIAVWDYRMNNENILVEDIDSASGFMFPMYDHDLDILYVGGKGDSSVKYFEYSDGDLHFLTAFSHTEPQKGICFIPKRKCDVLKCEIAKGLRKMNNYVQPVSFVVPRKATLFQKDIFPETLAGQAALEGKEWFEGKDAEPIKVTLNPKERKKQGLPALGEEKENETVIAEKKTRGQLEAELKAAHKKIAELEAKLG